MSGLGSYYRIIYPGGDRAKLSTAWVEGYEEDDWAIASRRFFTNGDEAEVYGRELAQKHGLHFEGDTDRLHYLD